MLEANRKTCSIAVVTLGSFSEAFNDSLNFIPPKGWSVRVDFFRGANLPNTRSLVLNRTKADRLIFVDDDVLIAPRLYEELILSDDPVIGAAYPYRQSKHVLVAGSKPPFTTTRPPVYLSESTPRIFHPDWIGAGALSIDVRHVASWQERGPYFAYGLSNGTCTGEDIWFCDLCAKHGTQITAINDPALISHEQRVLPFSFFLTDGGRHAVYH
jgi:hypothetical protein